jgi:hypothetical protein
LRQALKASFSCVGAVGRCAGRVSSCRNNRRMFISESMLPQITNLSFGIIGPLEERLRLGPDGAEQELKRLASAIAQIPARSFASGLLTEV